MKKYLKLRKANVSYAFMFTSMRRGIKTYDGKTHVPLYKFLGLIIIVKILKIIKFNCQLEASMLFTLEFLFNYFNRNKLWFVFGRRK